MENEEKKEIEIEEVNHEQEARELEERLRTAIQGGKMGDSSGGW